MLQVCHKALLAAIPFAHVLAVRHELTSARQLLTFKFNSYNYHAGQYALSPLTLAS